MYILSFFSLALFKCFHIELPHTTKEDDAWLLSIIEGRSFQFLALLSLAIGMVEEFLFRIIPFLLLHLLFVYRENARKSYARLHAYMLIISSALFGYLHVMSWKGIFIQGTSGAILYLALLLFGAHKLHEKKSQSQFAILASSYFITALLHGCFDFGVFYLFKMSMPDLK